MSLYELPKIELPKIRIPKKKLQGVRRFFIITVLVFFASSVFGFLAGGIAGTYFYLELNQELQQIQTPLHPALSAKVLGGAAGQASQEEAIIKAVEGVSPAVVSIIITKDLPIVEEYYIEPFGFKIPQYRQKGVEKKQVGGGTGFIVSEDGLILTNKHVVLNEEVEYTVLTNEGQKFPAKVLDKDPFQDFAVIEIEKEQLIDEQGKLVSKPFPVVRVGNSDKLKIGQTVIAIGNALGEFRNTVSVGVISGLGRTITASGGGLTETLEDVIQTDAAINLGNSGGPLLNLKGEVIGINVAKAENAQNIGFAIPINYAKKDIEQIKTLGKIVVPYLGVYYCVINEKYQKEYNLLVNYGAWIGRDKYCREYERAVVPETPAEKVGLKRDDIILEFGGQKITLENSLAKIIQKYNPGDTVALKILREGEEKTLEVVLGELNE